MNRRGFLKGLALAPVAALAGASSGARASVVGISHEVPAVLRRGETVFPGRRLHTGGVVGMQGAGCASCSRFSSAACRKCIADRKLRVFVREVGSS